MPSTKTMLDLKESGLLLAASLAILASLLAAPSAAAAGSVQVEVTVLGDGAPLNGATLTLLAGSTVIDATNESVGGKYELTADPGGYLLSVVPSADSVFGPTTVPVSVTAPGPTQITVALSSANPPPDPGEPTVFVSGRLTGGNGAVGTRLRVQFGSSERTYSVDTDRTDGGYSLLLPSGDYIVRIIDYDLTPSQDGWPSAVDLTYVIPVTIPSGVESQTLNLAVPFVAQQVVAKTSGGDPAVGVSITATGEDRSLTASIGDAPATWGLRDLRTTNSAGEATLWVLPGTYRMVGRRGTDFAADVVLEDVPLPDPDLQEFTFEPLVRPEITGRMVDRAGNGIGGGFSRAILRPVGGGFQMSDNLAADGTFRVPRPDSEGPFELLVFGPDRIQFGTPPYLDARSWTLEAGPFALIGNEDLGDIVVPGVSAQVCTVGRSTGDPVQAFVSADAVINDIPVGSAIGSLSFNQSFSLPVSFGGVISDCTRTVVPPGVEITFEVRPNGIGLEQGYIQRTTQIIARFDPDDPDRVEDIFIPVDNFADLDQNQAVDVEFLLVNTTGLPIAPLSLDFTPPTDPIFTRSTFTPDGAVVTRLVRQRHVVTSSGSLPADWASKRGNVRLTLALDETDLSRPGIDLGPIEFPYIPVDVTVRGVDGVPLSGALINTTVSRQFCVDGTGIVEQVCARSTYDALSNSIDRVRTNAFGRARIWLVPALYTVRISAPSGGTGYQGQDIPLSIQEGSQGVAVFANLVNSNIDPAPVPPLQISAGGPYTVAEGGSVGLTAIVVSGTADTVTWDLSGNEEFDVPGAQVSLNTSSGPAVVPIAVRACDADDICVFDITSVTVSNIAPTLATMVDRSAAGGDELVVSTTFTDPGAGDEHTGSVEVIGSATVVAMVLSPTTDGPGSVEATITAPACPTEADCEVPVTIRVSDGFASGTTNFVLTVAGTPGSEEPTDELFQDRFEP